MTPEEKHEVIFKKGKEFGQLIDELLPEGKAKQQAFTRLEEACMWAQQSIVRAEIEGRGKKEKTHDNN